MKVLIIGGGIAGLRASIEASKKAEVTLVSRIHPLRSGSSMAQGGINASKDWKTHAEDTIVGGRFLSDQDAVKIMCKNALSSVKELERWGVIFSEEKRKFAGLREKITYFVDDRTGSSIIHALYNQALKRGVKILSNIFILDLAVDGKRCYGAVGLDMKNGEIKVFPANATIIASGGFGRIYKTTTNADINTGYLTYIAYKSGAELKDMEFVQFHPTSLKDLGILITETVRTEGAYIINSLSKRFVDEKMPRDVVSREIFREILSGREVFLDVRHLSLKNFPEIRRICRDFAKIDPKKELIPIEPAQHYSIGGIRTDTLCRTNIEGLYAVGECSCLNVHGANRLGGNSLTECLVFGRIAGEAACNEAPTDIDYSTLEEKRDKTINKIENIFEKNERNSFKIRKKLQEVMFRNVGIIRNENDLKKALKDIKLLKEEQRYSGAHRGLKFNFELLNVIELEGMLNLAEIIVLSALKRKESRGVHYREDFPEEKDSMLKHLIFENRGERHRIKEEDVKITMVEL